MADRDIPGNGGPNRKASEPMGRSSDETRSSSTSTGSTATGGTSAGGTSAGDTGGTMKRMGGEMAGQAADLGRQTVSGAQGRIRSLLEQQTDRAADQLGGVAAALHKAAESLSDENNRVAARYAGQAAERVEEVADMIRNSTLDDMLGQVEGFARRQPEMFIGGALALGFLAARFIKSSGEGHYSHGYEGQSYTPTVNRGRTAGRSPYARSYSDDLPDLDTSSRGPSRGMAGGIADSASRATPRSTGTGGLGSGLGGTGTTNTGTGTGLPPQNTATAATTAARTRDAADLISGVGGSGPAAASAGKPTGTIPEETLGSSPASTAKPQTASLSTAGTGPTTPAATPAANATANSGTGGTTTGSSGAGSSGGTNKP